METLTQVVRTLSWHIRADSQLFIPPADYDEIKIQTALYLIEGMQKLNINAKMLIGEGWGKIMPLHWPEHLFVRTLKEAECEVWDKVWLWGMNKVSDRPTNRKKKSSRRQTELSHLLSMSKDIIQVIGLYDEQSTRPKSIIIESELPKINYDELKLKFGFNKKFDAKLRDALTQQIRTYISYQIGEYRGHKKHTFYSRGSGGLVELSYYLALELHSYGSPEFLISSLEQQMTKYEVSKDDPMLHTFLEVLKSKC